MGEDKEKAKISAEASAAGRAGSVFIPFDLMEGGGCGSQWFPVEASSAGTLHGNDLSG